MIGRIKGTLLEKNPPALLVDVRDIGYELYASMTTIFRLPELGQVVTLYTHLVVREDAQILYAFMDKQERALFLSLIKVNGIGPKMALAILSSLDAQQFHHYVSQNDVTALTKIPGVGRKTAERLVIEMRDKNAAGDVSFMTEDAPSSPAHDAISALVALGYKPQQADQTVKGLLEQANDSETLIRLSLKALNKF